MSAVKSILQRGANFISDGIFAERIFFGLRRRGGVGGPGQRIVCATQPLHRVCPNRFSLAIKLNCANTALVAGLEGNLGTGGQCRRCATNTLISSPPRFLEWCRFSTQNWCKDCYGQFFIRVMERIKVKVFCRVVTTFHQML